MEADRHLFRRGGSRSRPNQNVEGTTLKTNMEHNHELGGGFKYFLFPPLLGEDFQFD